MAENSKIEWTDHTFNPWRGCSRVSAGCINCYAENQAKRNPAVLGEWGTGKRVIAGESYWQQPLKWNQKAEKEGRRYRVFCGSMMDVFEDRPELEAPRNKLLMTIFATTHLDWLLLTKRPENAQDLCWRKWRAGIPENVWIGVSAEDQETSDKRVHQLLQIPAAVQFISYEPLLGPIDPSASTWGAGKPRQPLEVQAAQLTHPLAAIDWVIVGGESGPKARPMHPTWVRSIRNQCIAAGVPFFFKQWGEWAPAWEMEKDWPAWDKHPARKNRPYIVGPMPELRKGTLYIDKAGRIQHFPGREGGSEVITGENVVFMERIGKKAAGRLLDGRTWDEMPA